MSAETQSSDPTSISSLVLQSKRALQTGEALCSHAHVLSNLSAQAAFDFLALEASVRWTTEAMSEQFKLAGDVAKAITQKRATLEAHVKEWDVQRVQRTEALDSMLDSLGSQVVPPDFHHPDVDEDVFTSPEDNDPFASHSNGHNSESSDHDALSSPATIRGELPATNGTKLDGPKRRRQDRKTWKTLRDFVDERGIEDALDKMEQERMVLEDLLLSTADFAPSIDNTITTFKEALPGAPPKAQGIVQEVLEHQERTSVAMATHLESLAVHFDQMEAAQRDSEAGEIFGDEDMQEMSRDVNHLPTIIKDLEAGLAFIEGKHQELLHGSSAAAELLETQKHGIDELDALGDMMSEMLDRQNDIEAKVEAQLLGLFDYLSNLEALQTRFAAYQFSYSRLLLELGRRAQYIDAANKIVRGMNAQLTAMVEEERAMRESFKAEHGDHLPDDLCLAIENLPTKWETFPISWMSTLANGSWSNNALRINGTNGHDAHRIRDEVEVETVPEVDADLLADARDRVAGGDGGLLASLASI